MSYIDHTLLPNERVVYRARLHWVLFVPPALPTVAGLIALGAAHAAGEWLLVVGGVLLVVAAAMWLRALVAFQSTEFGVTNKRVIVKVGFLRRKTIELLLRQVEALSVEQTIAGRIFGFGSLTLTGTGGVREVFHHMGAPLEFRRQVQAQATM